MSDFPAVSLRQWRSRVESELDEGGFEKLVRGTPEGFRRQPLYSREEFVAAYGAPPGGRDWPLPNDGTTPRRCQHYESRATESCAAQIGDDRRHGVRSFWIRLDHAVRVGRDAPMLGERDRGVHVRMADDLVPLLEAARMADAAEGAPRAELVQVVVDAAGNAVPAAALAVAAAELAGWEPESVRLRVHADPLAALARDGALPDRAERLIAETRQLLDTETVTVAPLSVSVAAYARAGADAADQLAFALATAVQYLRWLDRAGVSPESAFGGNELVFELDRDVLIEVSKLRAARLLWARLQEACGVAITPLTVHAATGWRTLTVRDSHTNMLRATTQTVAAIAGGADVVTTRPHDARTAADDRVARRVARNTAAILLEESHLADTLDPAGGAWAVEAITAELAREAWQRFRIIEGAGGMARALREGRLLSRLETAMTQRAEHFRRGDAAILGVTHHRPPVEDLAAEVTSGGGAEAAPEADSVPDHGGDDAGRGSRSGGFGFDSLVAAARTDADIFELAAMLRPSPEPERATPLWLCADEDLVDVDVDAGSDGDDHDGGRGTGAPA